MGGAGKLGNRTPPWNGLAPCKETEVSNKWICLYFPLGMKRVLFLCIKNSVIRVKFLFMDSV